VTEKPAVQTKKVEINEEELANLNAELANAKRDLGLALAREKKRAKNQPPPPATAAPAPTEHKEEEHEAPDPSQGKETATGHLMHKWQHFCTGPNCEGENPDFKDETICDPAEGGCGMHLGSVEVAKTLARCPSCGGKKIARIKK
jgi:hypothetical protein